MLEDIKRTGIGSKHEFLKNSVSVPLPSRNGRCDNFAKKEIVNRWYDKYGLNYCFENGVLRITAKEFFPQSIIPFINALPKGIKVVLKVSSCPNEVAGVNMLFNILSIYETNKQIDINLTECDFGIGTALEFDKLHDNVKVSNRYLGMDEKEIYGGTSFDWTILNYSDEDFYKLVDHTTPLTRTRMLKLRNIAYNFYCNTPNYVKIGDIKTKADYVYNWCLDKIAYDVSATMPDGSLNFNRKDSQDPIETFNKKKGVCAGRSKLMKVLLNNYYMKAPCFLVDGISGHLQHEWNEVITEDGIIHSYDLSRQGGRVDTDHRDLNISRSYLQGYVEDNIRNRHRLRLKPKY